jgi:sodium transport system permease protein
MADINTTSPIFSAGGPFRRQPLGRLGRLVLKELREIFRDRRTIVTLIVMPVLIYPLLALVFQRFLLTSLAPTTELHYSIAVETELDEKILSQQIKEGQAILDSRGNRGERNFDRENAVPELSFFPLDLGEIEPKVAESQIHLGAICRRQQTATLQNGLTAPLTWVLVYRVGTPASVNAMHYVEERLQALNESRVDHQLRRLGVSATLPAAIKRRAIAFAGAPMFSLAALVPLILVLTTMTGAVYPAIDLTAGERERGTMEMLIAAPVPRFGLLVAKYIAVLCVALLTAIVNLFGMTITAQSTGLATMLFGDAGMTLSVMFRVWLLLGLFAAFFSGVLLAITSYARSFKEAQAYIVPLMLICLVPGVICLLPGLEFSLPMAVVPLVNIVMLGRDVLEGDYAPGLAAAAVLSTAIYVAASLALASRIFGTDVVLSGGSTTWSDVLRRPLREQTAFRTATAMLSLAVMFPTYFVAAGTLAQMRDDTTAGRVIKSALITVLVFVAIPLTLGLFQRIRQESGFGVRRPRLAALVGAFVLGISTWPLAYELFFINEALGIKVFNLGQYEAMRDVARSLQQLPWPLLMVALGIVPGICEEYFFRGMLFGALRKTLSAWGAICWAAAVFGLFHVVSGNAFLPERFIPSAFLGLALGWVRWKSDSVIPSMLMHVAHNSVLLAVMHWEPELKAAGFGVHEEEHLPIWWIAASIVLAGAGAWIVGKLGRRNHAEQAESPIS